MDSKSIPIEDSKIIVMDLESNGLLYEATDIHCIVLNPGPTEESLVFTSSSISGLKTNGPIAHGVAALIGYLKLGYTLVGHNVLGFDIPLLQKLGFVDGEALVNQFSIVDTYIGVCLRFPEEKPGLDHWGRVLGISKPAIEDWSTLSPTMVHRCVEDTKINWSLFEFLKREGYLESQWVSPRSLEQKVLWIHSQQVLHGMRVDIIRSKYTIGTIDRLIDKLTIDILKELPVNCRNLGELKKVIKTDGSVMSNVSNYFSKYGIGARGYYESLSVRLPDPKSYVRIGGPFSRVEFEPVNLNSHPQMKSALLDLGWRPTQWNERKEPDGSITRMSPKLTEDSFSSLPGTLGPDLTEYLMLKHRRRFVLNETDATKGLLPKVRSDGRVACDAFTCGTPTGRYRHTGAFVNLPRVSSPWGPEIRSLFCVPDDRYLIGIDLDGIEARMMAHYTTFYDGGEFAKEVLKGDIHSVNAKALGVDRDTAKTFYYAINYGAGKGKLRSILGCSAKVAQKKIDDYWRTNKGLNDLISRLESEYAAKGHITGLDGRELYVRGSHKLLNTLIQNAATIVFKRWMVACYEETVEITGVNQVLAYHDELGFEVRSPANGVAAKWGAVLSDAARVVGEQMKLNVPISASAKVGKRYSEVH